MRRSSDAAAVGDVSASHARGMPSDGGSDIGVSIAAIPDEPTVGTASQLIERRCEALPQLQNVQTWALHRSDARPKATAETDSGHTSRAGRRPTRGSTDVETTDPGLVLSLALLDDAHSDAEMCPAPMCQIVATQKGGTSPLWSLLL